MQCTVNVDHLLGLWLYVQCPCNCRCNARPPAGPPPCPMPASCCPPARLLHGSCLPPTPAVPYSLPARSPLTPCRPLPPASPLPAPCLPPACPMPAPCLPPARSSPGYSPVLGAIGRGPAAGVHHPDLRAAAQPVLRARHLRPLARLRLPLCHLIPAPHPARTPPTTHR